MQSRILRRLFAFFTVFCALFFSTLQTKSAIAAPSVSAASAVLYAPKAGIFLYEKEGDQRHFMASTTKIMTALVALDHAHPSELVSVHPGAVGIEGSSVYLTPGECVTMETLLYAMMLGSANDAAAAIAIEVGGSIEGFSRLMNEKAASLGLSDTHFDNPHGLHEDTHYTTARELALITAEAMKKPFFRQLAKTKKKVITLASGARTLVNHNKLLFAYGDVIGVKTGFTKRSGRCLVSAAEKDGVLLIAVTLSAPNDWQDHRALLDYGFGELECRTLKNAGEMSLSLPCKRGKKTYTVHLTNRLPLSVTLKTASELPTVRVSQTEDCDALKQLRVGDHFGVLEAVNAQGRVLASVPLVIDSIQRQP